MLINFDASFCSLVASLLLYFSQKSCDTAGKIILNFKNYIASINLKVTISISVSLLK